MLMVVLCSLTGMLLLATLVLLALLVRIGFSVEGRPTWGGITHLMIVRELVVGMVLTFLTEMVREGVIETAEKGELASMWFRRGAQAWPQWLQDRLEKWCEEESR